MCTFLNWLCFIKVKTIELALSYKGLNHVRFVVLALLYKGLNH